jgi:hypothetical protein
VDAPAVAGGDDGDEAPELVVVGIAMEEVLAARGVTGDVVQPVGEACSQRPGHAFRR